MIAPRIFYGFLTTLLGTGLACSSSPQGAWEPAEQAAGAPQQTGSESQAGSDANAGTATGGGAAGAANPVAGSGGVVGVDAKAGAGGSAGRGGEAASGDCKTDADCADTEMCNGSEACVNGACQKGDAVVCGASSSCSEAAQGACVYTDQSPWIVYQADDDTPGVQELYAIKRGLIGKMEPLKLSGRLDSGWQAFAPGWSPDAQLYLFVLRHEASDSAKLGFVYFDEQGPGLPHTIEGDNPRWSPSGRYLVVEEANAVAVYENEGEGKLTRVVHQAGASHQGYRCQWLNDDQLFFTMRSSGSTVSSIYRAAPGAQGFQASAVLDVKNLEQFWPSPDGTALTYDYQTDTGEVSALFVISTSPGSKRRELAPAGAHSVSWSPDGSQLLLVNSFSEPGQVLLGENPVRNRLGSIAEDDVALWARFSPDGSRILLAKPVAGWGAELVLLDQNGAELGNLGRQGTDDAGLYWAANEDAGLMVMRNARAANRELALVSVGGRTHETLDSITPDQRYGDYAITPRAEFVAYTKGVEPSFDGAYVDLRYAGALKPVRMPGEGTVWSFGFDASGLGLLYIRERDNGARRCFYLDLSAQVAAAPIEIGRDGRVSACVSQPIVD